MIKLGLAGRGLRENVDVDVEFMVAMMMVIGIIRLPDEACPRPVIRALAVWMLFNKSDEDRCVGTCWDSCHNYSGTTSDSLIHL